MLYDLDRLPSNFRLIDGPPVMTPEQLEAVLRLSTMWAFDTIRRFAIQQLECALLPPLARIELARKYSIDDWLVPAYAELCQRKSFIEWEEAENLGLQKFFALAHIRDSLARSTEFKLEEAIQNDARLVDPPAKISATPPSNPLAFPPVYSLSTSPTNPQLATATNLAIDSPTIPPALIISNAEQVCSYPTPSLSLAESQALPTKNVPGSSDPVEHVVDSGAALTQFFSPPLASTEELMWSPNTTIATDPSPLLTKLSLSSPFALAVPLPSSRAPTGRTGKSRCQRCRRFGTQICEHP